jgi:Carboxypeptidase regulatory-like domain
MRRSRKLALGVAVLVLVIGAVVVWIFTDLFTGADPHDLAPGTISGRVECGGTGRGLEGVLVVAGISLDTRENAPTWEMRTDERGEFRFEDLAEAGYLLVAYPGDRPHAYTVAAVTASKGDRVRIEIPRGRRLSGRVTDHATGAPIVGARLSVYLASKLRATTDAEGRYEIHGVERTSDLLVEADGYPEHAFTCFDPAGADLNGDVTLGAGGTILGRVVDHEGRGIEGVEIIASRRIYVPRYELERSLAPTATTGPDGSFRLEGLTKDRPRFLIAANVPEHPMKNEGFVFAGAGSAWSPDLDDPEVRLEPVGGMFRDIVLVRGPTGDLRVRVVDPSGQPVRYARIYGDYWSPGHWRWRWTDEDGWADLTGLSAGTFEFVVRSIHHRHTSARVVIREGETAETTVTLDPGVGVSGKVLFPDGHEVEERRVRAVPADVLRNMWYLEFMDGMFPICSTEPDGTFHISGLDANRDYFLTTQKVLRGMSHPVIVRDGAADQVLRVVPWAQARLKFRGVAVAESGVAAKASLCAQGDAALILSWTRHAVAHREETPDEITLSVHPGRYTVRLGETGLVALCGEITVREGQGEQLFRIPVGRGPVWSGTTRWRGGDGAAGIRVTLFDPDLEGEVAESDTDDNGWFEFRGLEGGHYRALLSGRRPETYCVLGWAEVHLDRAQASVSLDVGPRDAGALLIHAKNEAGRIVPGARVTIRDAAGRPVPTGAGMTEEKVGRQMALIGPGSRLRPHAWIPPAASITSPRGIFIRGSLAPGTYEVEVSADGFETTPFVAEILPWKKTSREIVLKRR